MSTGHDMVLLFYLSQLVNNAKLLYVGMLYERGNLRWRREYSHIGSKTQHNNPKYNIYNVKITILFSISL